MNRATWLAVAAVAGYVLWMRQHPALANAAPLSSTPPPAPPVVPWLRPVDVAPVVTSPAPVIVAPIVPAVVDQAPPPVVVEQLAPPPVVVEPLAPPPAPAPVAEFLAHNPGDYYRAVDIFGVEAVLPFVPREYLEQHSPTPLEYLEPVLVDQAPPPVLVEQLAPAAVDLPALLAPPTETIAVMPPPPPPVIDWWTSAPPPVVELPPPPVVELPPLVVELPAYIDVPPMFTIDVQDAIATEYVPVASVPLPVVTTPTYAPPPPPIAVPPPLPEPVFVAPPTGDPTVAAFLASNPGDYYRAAEIYGVDVVIPFVPPEYLLAHAPELYYHYYG